MTDLTLNDIEGGALGDDVGLVSCLSFEERGLVAARALCRNGLSEWVTVANVDIETDNQIIRDEAKRLSKRVAWRDHQIQKNRPLRTADVILEIANEIRSSSKRWVIDISTMTHELVLIFLAALAEVPPQTGKVSVLYNIASQYSLSESDRAAKWISRGILGVRSVVGYPGVWTLGQATTLIALPGFDLERVQRMVEELEPENLLVGVARGRSSMQDWMYERNRAVADHLVSGRRGENGVFEYNCHDPIDTATNLNAILRNVSGNPVVAPLNNKLSTVGVGLLALAKPSVQLCYAPALVYNINYSSPSNEFQWFSLDTLKKKISRIAG